MSKKSVKYHRMGEAEYNYIVELLDQKVSVKEISNRTNRDTSTIYTIQKSESWSQYKQDQKDAREARKLRNENKQTELPDIQPELAVETIEWHPATSEDFRVLVEAIDSMGQSVREMVNEFNLLQSNFGSKRGLFGKK